MQRKVSVSLNDLTHEMIVKQKSFLCVAYLLQQSKITRQEHIQQKKVLLAALLFPKGLPQQLDLHVLIWHRFLGQMPFLMQPSCLFRLGTSVSNTTSCDHPEL